MVVSMKKFIRRLFNLDVVNELKLDNQCLRNAAVYEAEKLRAYKAECNRLLDKLKIYNNEREKYVKTWKGLKKFDNNDLYFVVTQGGYYQIQGWKINRNLMSEVTRRAVKNGFVVATRQEAESLQEALKRLAW